MSVARRRRSSIRDDLVDLLGATALVLLALVGFHQVFGGNEYMIVGAVGALAGGAVAVVVARFRLPALFALAVALVVFLAVGAAAAIRDETLFHVLPTPPGVAGLLDGLVNGWRRLLTTLPPSGSFGNLLAIPFTLGFVGVLVATLLARLTGSLGTLVVVPGIVLGLSVLYGTRSPFSLLVQGAVFAGVALGWLALRAARGRRVILQSSGHMRWIGGLIMLGVIGAAGFAAGPRLPLASAHARYVLDRADPPFDPRQYPSPLNGYDRYLNGDLKDTTVFSVTGVPDEPGKTFGRVRLATMDDYNGVVWEVDPLAGSRSYQFLRVGESLPTATTGAAISVSLVIDHLTTIWVPDAGVVTGISWQSPGPRAKQQRNAFRLSTYTQTGAAPLGRGLLPGDAYTIRAVLPTNPTYAQLQSDHIDPSLRSKVSGVVPDVLTGKASDIVKSTTSPIEQATALNDWFHANGYYTEGDTAAGQSPLLPGHSAARLTAFLSTDTPVGSSEQFAATMALMAREVGLPARVVMGFHVENAASGTVDVKGHDVDAWVEIPFTDSRGVTGWVSFDPTPQT